MGYNLELEQKKHPYDLYGKVFEEEHGDCKYLMRTALAYKVDHYDSYLNSVELSHYEDLGYYEIVDFDLQGSKTLDLSWMRPNDVFLIEKNEQYSSVENIYLNVENLSCSYLPKDYGVKKNIVFLGNGLKFTFQQCKDLKRFIAQNRNCFKGIYFHGFNPIPEFFVLNGLEKSKKKNLKLKNA